MKLLKRKLEIKSKTMANLSEKNLSSIKGGTEASVCGVCVETDNCVQTAACGDTDTCPVTEVSFYESDCGGCNVESVDIACDTTGTYVSSDDTFNGC